MIRMYCEHLYLKVKNLVSHKNTGKVGSQSLNTLKFKNYEGQSRHVVSCFFLVVTYCLKIDRPRKHNVTKPVGPFVFIVTMQTKKRKREMKFLSQHLKKVWTKKTSGACLNKENRL